MECFQGGPGTCPPSWVNFEKLSYRIDISVYFQRFFPSITRKKFRKFCVFVIISSGFLQFHCSVFRGHRLNIGRGQQQWIQSVGGEGVSRYKLLQGY